MSPREGRFLEQVLVRERSFADACAKNRPIMLAISCAHGKATSLGKHLLARSHSPCVWLRSVAFVGISMAHFYRKQILASSFFRQLLHWRVGLQGCCSDLLVSILPFAGVVRKAALGQCGNGTAALGPDCPAWGMEHCISCKHGQGLSAVVGGFFFSCWRGGGDPLAEGHGSKTMMGLGFGFQAHVPPSLEGVPGFELNGTKCQVSTCHCANGKPATGARCVNGTSPLGRSLDVSSLGGSRPSGSFLFGGVFGWCCDWVSIF